MVDEGPAHTRGNGSLTRGHMMGFAKNSHKVMKQIENFPHDSGCF